MEFDIEYIDDEACESLAIFDINDPVDQEKIIELAIIPEFNSWNEISKNSLKQVLMEVDEYQEAEVVKLIQRIGTPFSQELVDYKAFFGRIRMHLDLDKI